MLFREIRVWSRLRHPNILGFLGFMLEEGVPSLVSEWMEHGTSFNYVKNNPDCDIAQIVSQDMHCSLNHILTSGVRRC